MSVAAFLAPAGWQRGDGGPLYLQLSRRLSEAMTRGLLSPGAPLPPEREIAALTGLSRVTVRKAIAGLAAEGLVVQKHGSGSFVAPRPEKFEQSLSRLTSFTEDMRRRGLSTTTRWLDRGVYVPSPDEVVALGLAADASVARLARLRLADGRPMAIERAALPLTILPDPEAVETSLYGTLAEAGLRPVRALQKISAIAVGREDAATLEVAPGAAGLSIERTSYLPDGRVAEFTRSLYRGDAYNFVAELRLAQD
ncbi:GntR family transcriptional regulator [Limimaricola pyoseonensis]|uniref:Transcriptional regulator, GntR family n=1 Tax=Limimaricola pyoseonensis TaxID=521013 RepID=A0A1G7L4H7_9RHOB|nr:GntR family transcriptional regulator [Limimaricola pyoseonensis]SDF44398.1 transcriptional regulator, GntR family [Limimaricola pyoseonensis]